MKNLLREILFVLLAVLIFNQKSAAQWTLISTGVTARLEAFHFINPQTGYCSGPFTYTFNTSNGGNTWSQLTTQGFKDFGFFNSTNGYGASVVGQSMAKTINGGANWTSLTPPNSNSLWGVAATSTTTAYFVGTGGILWKTINSGTTITIGTSGTTQQITDIAFTSPSTGFIVVQNGQIRRTTNSGLSWSAVYTNSSLYLTEMCFVNSNIGYVAGGSGTVLKTIDGGTSWNILNTNNTSLLQGINFIDADNGMVVGSGGTILITHDGGTTWHSQNSGTTRNLYDAWMFSGTSAMVCGDSGTILKNTNIITGVINDISKSAFTLSPNPFSTLTSLHTAVPLDRASLWIYNECGQLVAKTEELYGEVVSINREGLSKGIYLFSITENSMPVCSGRFVVTD